MRKRDILSVGAILASLVPCPAGAIVSSKLADTHEWTSILLFGSSGRYCSAAAIGPRVLLTAAHCVQEHSEAGTARAEVGGVRTQYQINCDVNPKFTSDISADYALCRTDQPIAVEHLERIGRSVPTASDVSLTIIGYGCRDRVTQNFDGRLSIGRASVTRLPSKENGYIIVSGSVACAGDAGGGLFSVQNASRTLVGIISRSDDVSLTWIAPVGVDRFLAWAQDWSKTNGVLICGISADQTAACTPRPQDAPIVQPWELRDANVLIANLNTPGLIVAADQADTGPVPLRTITYRAGEILRNVIMLTCHGLASEDFVNRSVEYLARIGTPIEKDRKFDADGTLTIPVCPSPSSGPDKFEIEIGPNDSQMLWYYFDKLSNSDKKFKQIWGWERPTSDTRSSRGRDSLYFLEAFKALNPKQDPQALKPGKIWLPLRPASLGPYASASSSGGQVYEPIPDVIPQSLAKNCAAMRDALIYPFDVRGVLNILSSVANRADRPNLTQPSRIVVVDSGLFDPATDGSSFPRRLLTVNAMTDELREEKYVQMLPRMVKADDAAHGTWVASAALGGALFARIMAAMPTPPITLRPDRYYDLIEGRVVILASTLDGLFNNLSQESGRFIVNLSLKSTQELPSVRQKLGNDQGNILFIVAAGNGLGDGTNNKGQLLQRNGANASYPAVYGGHGNLGSANLITVAAVYLDDKQLWRRAPFSDYGPTIVEIGAPGCAIPVLNYDNHFWKSEPNFVSGTSFSAPLVSFAAGMISSEVPDLTSSELKQRILAAADLQPQLNADIADGRVLDIVKSIAVYNDLIETEEGLQVGEMELRNRNTGAVYDWTQSFDVDCLAADGITKQDKVSLATLLKIAPRYNVRRSSIFAQSYPDLVYTVGGPDQQPEALQCKLPDDVAVYFARLGGGTMPGFNWSDLLDLVPRIPRVRSRTVRH